MMAIVVNQLIKSYRVHHKAAGLRASLRNLFVRRYQTVEAVAGISFELAQGEIVGFLGPNGAGKTTTLKCLSGLLHPNGGSAQVLGFTPHHRDHAFLKQITLVMGLLSSIL